MRLSARKIGPLFSVTFVVSVAAFSIATAQTNSAPSSKQSQTTPTTEKPVVVENVPFNGTFKQDHSPKADSIKVSDPVQLNFSFTHSIDAEIIAPEILPTKRWHIVDTQIQQKPLNGSEKETLLSLTVTVNRPGATTLPPLKFIVLDRSGSSSEVVSRPVSMKFVSTLPDTTELTFKPPKPPVEIWVEDFTLAWIGGLALIAGLFLALYLFMRNRRIFVEIPKPPRAAHDIALEKLATVAGQEISSDDENMAFYVLISEAIRDYMGSIWNFPGTELTTTEILKHLREKTFPLGLSQDDIGEFLKETDYVKFAGSKPNDESKARILSRAFSVIELTKALSFSQYTHELTQYRERYGGDATDGSVEKVVIDGQSKEQSKTSEIKKEASSAENDDSKKDPIIEGPEET